MAKKHDHRFEMMAIVAIVAVVGLVMMFINTGGDLAGEAVSLVDYGKRDIREDPRPIRRTVATLENDLLLGVWPFSSSGKYYYHDDLDFLDVGTVYYNGQNYEFREFMQMSSNSLIGETGEDHEEYGTDVYLEVRKLSQLGYWFNFVDMVFPVWEEDSDLNINFLGENLEITGSGNDFLVISTAEERWFNHGETITTEIAGVDYTITVHNVYSDTEALISVNGVQQLLSEVTGDTDSWGYENFELQLMNAVNDDGTENDIAKIRYGSNNIKQISLVTNLTIIDMVEFKRIAKNLDWSGDYTEDLVWNVDWVEDDATTAGELVLGSTNIGTRDYDFMTDYGVVVTAPVQTLSQGYGHLRLAYPPSAVSYDLRIGKDFIPPVYNLPSAK